MSDSSFKKHPCDDCNKSFSSSHQLAQHIRIHSGNKPYKCSFCDKTFKQLSHVQQHTRLHTGERPYKCLNSKCGRSFIQLSNLQQHMRSHVVGSEKSEREEKRILSSLSCPICGKTYVNEGSLRKHLQTTHADIVGNHSLSEYLQTNSQTNFFNQLNNREISLNENTFSFNFQECNVCKQFFATKEDLLKHLEDLKTDPKHQFQAQILLSSLALEKKVNQNSFNTSQLFNNCTNSLNQVENLLVMNNNSDKFNDLVQNSMQKYVLYYVQKS